jgi:hypothetical protein
VKVVLSEVGQSTVTVVGVGDATLSIEERFRVFLGVVGVVGVVAVPFEVAENWDGDGEVGLWQLFSFTRSAQTAPPIAAAVMARAIAQMV